MSDVLNVAREITRSGPKDPLFEAPIGEHPCDFLRPEDSTCLRAGVAQCLCTETPEPLCWKCSEEGGGAARRLRRHQ